MKPLYSIIIPTFNSEGTIHECLASLMTQTFTSFEILIMDGVSSDHTIDIAKSFDDNRIRINSEKDIGIYDAMNKGVKNAVGEWLYFLGSDDVLFSNNTLEDIASSLTKTDHVVYGNVFSTRFGGIYDGKFDYEKFFRGNICHQSIFFHRSVFYKVGLFNIKYKVHADWDHNLRWFFSNEINKRYVDVVIANYQDGGFSSRNSDILFSEDRACAYLRYGNRVLGPNRKSAIISSELKRAIITRNFKLFYKVLCSIIYLF